MSCNEDDAGFMQERVVGAKYDALFEELLSALRNRFGQSLLVHWEDFSSKNSYRLLQKTRREVRPRS